MTYVATGNMNMSWDFGTRSGQFDVTNFDKLDVAGGLNFGGAISMPGGASTDQLHRKADSINSADD